MEFRHMTAFLNVRKWGGGAYLKSVQYAIKYPPLNALN